MPLRHTIDRRHRKKPQQNRVEEVLQETSSEEENTANEASDSDEQQSSKNESSISYDPDDSDDEDFVVDEEIVRRSETDDSDDEGVYDPTNRSARTRKRIRQQRNENFEEGSTGSEDSPRRRSTPARTSARRANQKLVEAGDNEFEEETASFAIKKKRNSGSEDDEYVDEISVEEEEELSVDILTNESPIEEHLHNVDNDIVFTMDSDESDDRASTPSHSLGRGRRWRRARGNSKHLGDSDNDDASLSEFHTTPGSQKQQLVVKCSSTHDEITALSLPAKHVCYETPDKTTRHCFAIETLHKVAMTSRIQSAGDKPQFLQPPHFRAPMSDDLIDQIASRFGRAALELDGDFYKSDIKGSSTSPDPSDYIVNLGGSLDDEAFLERLNCYMSGLMGSQDIYCCPLCYTEAYQSLVIPDHHGDDASDNEHEEDFSFTLDPMTILGSLDEDHFHLASTFCFTKVSEVKKHLRVDHHVDTSVLDGNTLFSRFKLRESDGLLQRYIDNCHWMAYQGSMARYWNEGNNQMFILLLNRMKHLQAMKEILKDRPENEQGLISAGDKLVIDDAEVFLESFRKRAQKVWDRLSGPYRRESKRELDSFIDNGEVEVEMSHPMFYRTPSNEATPEDQIIDELRKRRGRAGNSDSEQSASSSSSQNDSDSASSFSNHEESEEEDTYPEEEVEEDEWIQELRSRRKSRRKPSPRTREVGEKPAATLLASAPTARSASRKRRIIESDEDSSE